MAPRSPRARTWALLAGPALLALWGASACEGVYCELDSPTRARPSNWEELSHCAGHEPDYAEVFNFDLEANAYEDDDVHRFDITISAADHDLIDEDVEHLDAHRGDYPDLDGLPTPIYVPATVRYGGQVWTQVGFRRKGHASLLGTFHYGEKYSFVLDFDHYGDTHRSIENQRFFGFSRLSFSSAYLDCTRMRERLAGEVFRSEGIRQPRRAFAEVYLDWGEGAQYLGVFVMVEDPCDAMLRESPSAEIGNLYKPWGDAARWLGRDETGEDEIREYFDMCNEAAEGRAGAWQDVFDSIDALHDDPRNTEAWRTTLESHLDVESFLRTLAANRVMPNWDSYGCMSHNYFIYDDPETGRFEWFPWDLNEAIADRTGGDCDEPGSVMADEVGDDWPLIRFLLDDPVYRQDYIGYVRDVLDEGFGTDLDATIDQYHDLIAPYIVGPEGVEAWPYDPATECRDEDFDQTIDDLHAYVEARRAEVEAELAAEGD